MIIKKGTVLKTKNATWHVKEDQKTDDNNDYVRAESEDGFKALVNLQSVKIIIRP